MTLRAGIVVTGTEVLTGRVADRNGPWLAEQLLDLGVDVGRIVVVGDRQADLEAALMHLITDHDLVITTGGLGPTADDLTARVVGDVQGRPSRLDAALQERISEIIDRLVQRYGRTSDPISLEAAARKQALVPDGAVVLDPVGTAPGLVVPPADGRIGPPVVVLPGPPGELRAMWLDALASGPVHDLLGARKPLQQNTIRLWRTWEAELARSLRTIEADVPDLEITTCLREGELEIVTRYPPDAMASAGAQDVQAQYDLLQRRIETDFAATVFSTDGSTVDDVVARRLISRGWTIATAESCTGGLLAARLTARPGSSAYVMGAVVVYDNSAKTRLAEVPSDLIETHGAVSHEVADALADGARTALDADVGVGITGVAGPDGGTADKPVGTVHLSIVAPSGRLHRELHLTGSRDTVRQRTVVTALHELRLLIGQPHQSAGSAPIPGR